MHVVTGIIYLFFFLVIEVQNCDSNSVNMNSYLSQEFIYNIPLEDINYDKTRDYINCGGFGTVYKAIHSIIGTVALKTLHEYGQTVSTKYLTSLQNEVLFLSKIRHPNIILLHGMITHKDIYAIVMEYMPFGDLYIFLHNNKPINGTVKTKFACDIVQGIQYLHSQQTPIVHNDLKINNVLVSNVLIAKICDFGLAQWRTLSTELMTQNGIYSKSNCNPAGATCTHLSPERWDDINLKDKRCDIYSFGILLWEIYSEQKPFGEIAHNFTLLKISVKDKQRPDLSLLPKSDLYNEQFRLIELCWHHDPTQRPNASAILFDLNTILHKPEIDACLREETIAIIQKIHFGTELPQSKTNIEYIVFSSNATLSKSNASCTDLNINVDTIQNNSNDVTVAQSPIKSCYNLNVDSDVEVLANNLTDVKEPSSNKPNVDLNKPINISFSERTSDLAAITELPNKSFNKHYEGLTLDKYCATGQIEYNQGNISIMLNSSELAYGNKNNKSVMGDDNKDEEAHADFAANSKMPIQSCITGDDIKDDGVYDDIAGNTKTAMQPYIYAMVKKVGHDVIFSTNANYEFRAKTDKVKKLSAWLKY